MESDVRHRIFLFVQARLLAGQPPTVREVQAEFGFRAVQSAQAHLEALVASGRLTKEAGRSRGYRLPDGAGGRAQPVQHVPILGRVQAGALAPAIEDLEGYVPVAARPTGDEVFALRVQGESMVGAGILPGDLVVVRRQATARSGEIVVALVDGEATIKRLRVREGRAELHAEHPDFPPLRPEGMELLGKVIEVRRDLER